MPDPVEPVERVEWTCPWCGRGPFLALPDHLIECLCGHVTRSESVTPT